MVSKKHKSSIRTMMSGTDTVHWSLALQILTGQLNRNNAESMVIQYIINIHNNTIKSKDRFPINEWVKEKITNEKLIRHFTRTFKFLTGLRDQLEVGHQMVHNGSLALSDFIGWFDSVDAARQPKRVTLQCGSQTAKLFDELMKEEANR